ncbi:Cytochrome [Abeliophyllum distichum]|uniref:Cytochrome n=1 Tax=Abeliophyllum distichum TaxID=126358 RepID=A0ABD1TIS3_9LAMI
MEYVQLLIVLFIVGYTSFYALSSNSRRRRSGKLPPGPYPFPIIGNILQIGRHPHRSLTKLAKIYGPIMYLKLGSIDTIVVSSPKIAKEVLQKHDHLLSSRRIPAAAEVHDHSTKSMLWLPVADQWRILRKISKEQVFSVPRLEASQGLRQEKLQNLCDFVHECSINHQLVDIGKAAFIASLNLMSATLFSGDGAQYNSDSAQELKETIVGMAKILATPNFSDFFPVLKSIDPQRIKHESKRYFGKAYSILDDMINQRLKLSAESLDSVVKNDFLQALLDYSRNNSSEFPIDNIKHLLLDLFAGGTEAAATTVVWIMTELVRNPDKMSKARNELWDVIGRNNKVKESDISRLPYLQSVIKETFRYHPTGPLLVPHKADVDTEINGYIVPKDSQIFVNIWAMGRDPNIWSNPNSFEPERFLKREIDIKGQDFDLIPFGSGRRICPGLPLATRMLPLMVATMIHNFDWKLEGEMKPEEVDISEKFGVALEKAVPLKAFPIKL